MPDPTTLPRLTWLLDQLPASARGPMLISLAALAGWLALYGLVLLVTRPLPVPAGPAGQDLPGDEPPAVVSVLAGGWAVTEDAAEATLLDLAARGYLELRQPDADPRHTTVHVTADSPQAAEAAAARRARVLRAGGGQLELTRYERQVLEHVGRIAVGGVVPLTALTFRDPAKASAWARRFESAVLADARARGLIQRRVPGWTATLLSFLAVLPALAIGWLAWQLDSKHDGGALSVAILPWGALSALAGRSRGYRGTAAGRQAASRWFGLRDYLRVDRAFAGLPPAAVAVWDRYLAYGDALGVTHVASAAIDLGMANRKRVWSSYDGGWHQVRVRYPAARPRYGTGAVRLCLTSLVTVAAGYGLVRLSGLAALGQVRDRWSAVAGAVPLVGVLLMLLGGYRLLRTLVDLLNARTLRGEVLWVAVWRTRRQNNTDLPIVHYLAVDDGTGDRTTAWALPEGITRGFGPGDVIELRVRPWSRRITSATVLQSRQVYGPDLVPPPPVVAPGVPAATSGPGGGELLSAQELAAWFGVPLVATRLRDAGLPVNAWLYRQDGGTALAGGPLPDGGAGRPVVLVSAGSGLVDRMLLRGHRRGQRLPGPGLGDEAYLTEHSAVARKGDVVVRVSVPASLPVHPDVLVTALRTAIFRLS